MPKRQVNPEDARCHDLPPDGALVSTSRALTLGWTLIAVLGLYTAWSCGGGSQTPAPTPSPTQSPTPEPTPACASGEVWPQFQHDARHTGRSSWPGPRATPQRLWVQPYGYDFQGSMVVGPSCVSYGISSSSYGSAVYAFARDGTVLWQHAVEGEANSTPALSSTGVLYVHSHDSLHALKSDGSQLWEYSIGGGPVASEMSSPTIGPDGTIYVGALNAQKLVAVRSDGSLRWEYATGPTYSSPALGSDGTIYIGSRDYLYAIGSDGHLLWKFSGDSYFHCSPVIADDGTIYIASIGRYLYALTPGGQERWRFDMGNGSWSTPALAADGTLYVYSGYPSNSGVLRSITPYGVERWQVAIGAYEQGSSPTVDSNGIVYIASLESSDGHSAVRAFAADATPVWTYATLYSRTPVSIGSDGTLYVGRIPEALR